jgi:hypothetical protein
MQGNSSIERNKIDINIKPHHGNYGNSELLFKIIIQRILRIMPLICL